MISKCIVSLPSSNIAQVVLPLESNGCMRKNSFHLYVSDESSYNACITINVGNIRLSFCWKAVVLSNMQCVFLQCKIQD